MTLVVNRPPLTELFNNLDINDVDVVYFGIGCCVNDDFSSDQQLPKFLLKFYSDENEKRAKAFLFDPRFRNERPLSVDRLIASSTPTKPCNFVDGYSYSCGGLQVIVSNSYFETAAPFFNAAEQFIIRLAKSQKLVYLAVFTQPYLRVEENWETIDMYHRVLDVLEPLGLQNRIQYYHLAAYGTPNSKTVVWMLKGQRHDQDKALLKEVVRYEGSTPTFGVGCYAAFPGRKYGIHSSPGKIDYHFIYDQVCEDAKLITNPKEWLEIDDIAICDIVLPDM